LKETGKRQATQELKRCHLPLKRRVVCVRSEPEVQTGVSFSVSAARDASPEIHQRKTDIFASTPAYNFQEEARFISPLDDPVEGLP
jgi:hypothetical protein